MGVSFTKPNQDNVYFSDYAATVRDQTGKSFAITGTTSGTGFILARTVGSKGGTVFLLNRESPRSKSSLEQLKEFAPNGDFHPIVCDLQDLESVERAAKEVQERVGEKGLNVLVNNAGVMALEDVATKDGYDIQMQTNYYGHFVLTKALYPSLLKASETQAGARVVQHTSVARLYPSECLQNKYFAKTGGRLGGNGQGWMMNGPRWKRYNQSKLANATFAYCLADRFRKNNIKIKSLLAHPGFAATELQATANAHGGMSNMWMMKFAQSQEDGALGILKCACDPSAKNGDFYGPVGHATAFYGDAVELDRDNELFGGDSPSNKEFLWRFSEQEMGPFEI